MDSNNNDEAHGALEGCQDRLDGVAGGTTPVETQSPHNTSTDEALPVATDSGLLARAQERLQTILGIVNDVQKFQNEFRKVTRFIPAKAQQTIQQRVQEYLSRVTVTQSILTTQTALMVSDSNTPTGDAEEQERADAAEVLVLLQEWQNILEWLKSNHSSRPVGTSAASDLGKD